MPGMYAAGDYDLAGFCVGAVERGEQLTGEKVAPGHVLLGLASSGVHSNGYSLVRRLAEDKGWRLDRPALFEPERLLIEALIEPTRIYVKSLLPTVRAGKIDALGAHHRRRAAREHAARAARRRARGDRCRRVGAAAADGVPAGPGQHRAGRDGADVQLRDRHGRRGAGLSWRGKSPPSSRRRAKQVVRIGEVIEGPRGCTVRGAAGTWSAKADWSATHGLEFLIGGAMRCGEGHMAPDKSSGLVR